MHSRLDAITDWPERARAARYRVSEVAGAVGVTRQQLRAYFLRRFGVAPGLWLVRLKMQDAGSRLRQRDLIKSMSSDLGYAHPTHFARAFRLQTGAAPSAWRAQDPERAPRTFPIGLKLSKKVRKLPERSAQMLA
jgi:AraC-like DNA-binding protein